MTAPCARPRLQPRWRTAAPPDETRVAALAEALQLPDIVCRLLAARGFDEPDAAKSYLRPRLETLHATDGMADVEAALDRLERAARTGETVLIHGDYDVDGICSTALLTRCLGHFGARPVPFIPRRLEDGYDLTDAGVRAAHAAGATLVLTCDCGTSAREPVAALVARGVDVIISDHHLPGGPLPECLAVLNPRRADCAYPDKDLAAVGVAFKLMLALARRLGTSENLVLHHLDLVALATIADVAPLRGENRVLARFGLKLMAQSPNPGVRALVRAAGLADKPLTAGRVGFILAPRLNAVGRLGHALRGVELLLAGSESEANPIARELEELNRKRQDLDRATLEQARRMVERLDLDEVRGIVLADERWHPGVIGIVASRLVEETGRPVMLIALDGEVGKGSGRSISAFDLHGGLTACRELLLRFGGHRAAAGVTIARERVPEFTARFNQVARERLSPDDLVPDLRVDVELPLGAADDRLETLLRHFEPFGMGNPAPVFGVRGVTLAEAPRVVGSDGLKLRLAGDGATLDALGWGMGARAAELSRGDRVDVAFRLERDSYRGEERLQARLLDLVVR